MRKNKQKKQINNFVVVCWKEQKENKQKNKIR
jgi:hypothetical protein